MPVADANSTDRASSTALVPNVTQESAKCIFSIDVEDWFHILDLPSTPDLKILFPRVSRETFCRY
jgi:hypothetical protein